MMTEKLQNSPNKRFDITDDSQAEILLLELGILDRFTKKFPAHETTQTVVFNEHPTHHILAVLYLGHQNTVDNGYVIFCIPRSHLSAEQFHTFADKFLTPTPTNIVGIERFSGPPTRN